MIGLHVIFKGLQGVFMKIGIVLVTYSMVPEKLFKSIEEKTTHACRWYIHHHGQDQILITPLQTIPGKYDARLYLHMFNRGLARSWNDGIGESLTDANDLTLVINDDIEFIEDGFDRFMQFIDASGPDVGLAFLRGIEGNKSPLAGEIRSQDFGCFVISKKAINQIGFFDENFVPAYYEDFDYAWRMAMAGVKKIVDERPLVIHDRGNTTRSDPRLKENIDKYVWLCRHYITKKWGVDTWRINDMYDHPFGNDKYDFRIAWENRHTPYGPGYDRDDLNVLRMLLQGND